MGSDEPKQSKPSVASIRERIDAWCEWGILGLVLGVVLLGPVALGGVRPTEFLGLQFLTVAILVLWLVRFWFGKTQILLWAPICWAALPFLGYAVWRYATADIEYVARQELIRVLLYTALFFAILNNLHRQQTTRVVVLALLGLGTALSLYAVFQWVTGSEQVWTFVKPGCYVGRASGSYICPNHFAGFLAMLVPIAFSYTLTGRFKPVPRILLGYATLAMLAGIAVTLSWGAYTACGLALLVFFVCIFRQQRYLMFGGICLALILAGGGLFYFTTARARVQMIATQVSASDQNVPLRIWPVAGRMWLDHFWTGTGPGHFDQRYRAYLDDEDKLPGRPGYVHNDYLNTLADYGAVGLLLALLPWAALYWGVFWGWKYCRRKSNDLEQKKSNKAAFLLGAAIGLLALLFHSFVDFNLHIPANAILAVTLMALLTGHLRFATDRFWVSQRWKGRLLATLILGSVTVYLVCQGMQAASEQRWLQKAARKADDPVARRSELQKAFAAEPKNFETAYALGESFRQQSWRGEPGWEELAQDALGWYQRGAALNGYDPYFPVRHGMCLHWLKRHAEAGPWFERALKLDSHSYFMRAQMGWHFLQLEDYPKATEWFEKANLVNWLNSPLADSYLKIIEEKLAEKKTPPAN